MKMSQIDRDFINRLSDEDAAYVTISDAGRRKHPITHLEQAINNFGPAVRRALDKYPVGQGVRFHICLMVEHTGGNPTCREGAPSDQHNAESVIPPITDPLGSSWVQPARSELQIDNEDVRMSQKAFDKLLEYSTSIPSGKYPGKMWKLNRPLRSDIWYLSWYSESSEPGMLDIHYRKIVIEEAQNDA
jgi:hypothetical protein